MCYQTNIQHDHGPWQLQPLGDWQALQPSLEKTMSRVQGPKLSHEFKERGRSKEWTEKESLTRSIKKKDEENKLSLFFSSSCLTDVILSGFLDHLKHRNRLAHTCKIISTCKHRDREVLTSTSDKWPAIILKGCILSIDQILAVRSCEALAK